MVEAIFRTTVLCPQCDQPLTQEPDHLMRCSNENCALCGIPFEYPAAALDTHSRASEEDRARFRAWEAACIKEARAKQAAEEAVTPPHGVEILEALRGHLDDLVGPRGERPCACCKEMLEEIERDGLSVVTLSPRELATVLAALRYWQDKVLDFQPKAEVIALDSSELGDHFTTCTPLNAKEVDTLCEHINCGGKP